MGLPTELVMTDEEISDCLAHLLTTSNPGDTLHHLLLVPEVRTPLGVAEIGPSTMVVIDEAMRDETFLPRAVMSAILNAARKGRIIFAALALEVFAIYDSDMAGADEASENRARRLAADHLVGQHEKAVESTLLYAAAADGRRWTGDRIITGDRAGLTVGPELIRPGERHPADYYPKGPVPRLIRAAVGLRY